MRPQRTVGDAELLVATAGNPDAFGTFYRRHERALLSYFRRVSGSVEVAADLTAETFAQALASLDRYDPALGEPGAWLFGIGRHVLARSIERGRVEDRARVRLGMARLVIDDEVFERIEAMTSSDGAASAALDGLPAAIREAVAGRVIGEQDYGELARTLSCSESLVRKRVSRGLARMRRQLLKEAK
jgi:RNA polymerase sigma factor (sigma-70 family)